MVELNSVAIVDGFRHKVPDEVEWIISEFEKLIVDSIQKSRTVDVPDWAKDCYQYDALRRKPQPEPVPHLVDTPQLPSKEAVRLAAETLFYSYD